MPETDEHARSHLSGPPGGAGVDPDSASGQLRDVALAFLARYQGTAQARGEMRQRVGSPGGPRVGGGPDRTGAGGADQVGDPGDPKSGSAALTGGGSPSEVSSTRWRRTPGLAASRTRWDEPRALGPVLGHLAHRRGWDGPAAMGSVMAKWPAIVGAQVAEHCHIETFEGERLVVRCSSTAWTKQLLLLLPHIERRIEEEVGPGVVTQVIVRGPAAPSWKKGRLSVPGRGPRDTYG